MTLLKRGNSLRLLRACALSAIVALVVGVGVNLASPAQAVPVSQIYQNIYYWGCIIGAGEESDPNKVATTGTCGGVHSSVMSWYVISRGKSPAGNSLVQLQSTFNGKCLDTNSTDLGAIWEKTCAAGDNEVWEAFHQKQVYYDDEGRPYTVDTITFKSWGAWTYHARHRCMKATAQTGQVVLAVCDTDAATQNWAHPAAA